MNPYVSAQAEAGRNERAAARAAKPVSVQAEAGRSERSAREWQSTTWAPLSFCADGDRHPVRRHQRAVPVSTGAVSLRLPLLPEPPTSASECRVEDNASVLSRRREFGEFCPLGLWVGCWWT